MGGPASLPSSLGERASGPRGRDLLALVVILAAAVWLHLPALRTPFFADDYLFLDQVRGRSLPAALAAPDPISNFYRPIGRQVYFWLLSRGSNESPRAFHIGNLALLLLILVLFFRLARALSGSAAAILGTAFLALHYVTDIPVRWASGSQDLLAVAGALVTLAAYRSGHRWLAAGTFLLALFAKEVVVLTPLIAITMDRLQVDPWTRRLRRAWPFAITLGVWALTWLAMPRARTQQVHEVGFAASALPALPLHLLQVAVGWEWPSGRPLAVPLATPPWGTLALVVFACLVLAGSSRASRVAATDVDRSAGLAVGLGWALFGALPVVAVMSVWSAYHFLYAMCGVALILGAWLSRGPRPIAALALVIFACTSANARTLAECARVWDPWSARSHINRAYLQDAAEVSAHYLADLVRQRPHLPPRATVFFAGIRSHIGFQVADGPAVRWAYRDPTLRSYYLSAFTHETANRGPVFFFVASGDSLVEWQGPKVHSALALSMMVSDQPRAALELLRAGFRSDGASPAGEYWAGWLAVGLGDSTAGRAHLARSGVRWADGPSPEVPAALERIAAGDTVAARALVARALVQRSADPAVHALTADLALIARPDDPNGAIEAYAARVLAPEDPYAWRRWGMIQARRDRVDEAFASFTRYMNLGGREARADSEVGRWMSIQRSSSLGRPVRPWGLGE